VGHSYRSAVAFLLLNGIQIEAAINGREQVGLKDHVLWLPPPGKVALGRGSRYPGKVVARLMPPGKSPGIIARALRVPFQPSGAHTLLNLKAEERSFSQRRLKYIRAISRFYTRSFDKPLRNPEISRKRFSLICLES